MGIEGNELADVVKSACKSGIRVDNLVSFKEVICILREEYDVIDSLFR